MLYILGALFIIMILFDVISHVLEGGPRSRTH